MTDAAQRLAAPRNPQTTLATPVTSHSSRPSHPADPAPKSIGLSVIRKRFGVEEASNMLDHSSVKMTEVYAERDRQQAVEIARQVG